MWIFPDTPVHTLNSQSSICIFSVPYLLLYSQPCVHAATCLVDDDTCTRTSSVPSNSFISLSNAEWFAPQVTCSTPCISTAVHTSWPPCTTWVYDGEGTAYVLWLHPVWRLCLDVVAETPASRWPCVPLSVVLNRTLVNPSLSTLLVAAESMSVQNKPSLFATTRLFFFNYNVIFRLIFTLVVWILPELGFFFFSLLFTTYNTITFLSSGWTDEKRELDLTAERERTGW